VDVFPADGLQHDGVNVLPCGGGRFHLVEQVETVMLVWMIKEEGVRVFVTDVVCHHLRIASTNTMILVVAVL
jgi:hypothetical protein